LLRRGRLFRVVHHEPHRRRRRGIDACRAVAGGDRIRRVRRRLVANVDLVSPLMGNDVQVDGGWGDLLTDHRRYAPPALAGIVTEWFMDACIQQCRYLILLADSLLEGINDAHVAIEPRPGVKTVGWLGCSLAPTADFGRPLCGRKAICPREWRALFTPGTQPSIDPSTYPPIAMLREKFNAGYTDLCVGVVEADPSLLADVNPYEQARKPFYSVGAFVEHLIHAHV